MGQSVRDARLRIPESLRHRTEDIFSLTDAFCAEHLDAEYAELCRRLVARLARKRPSPLVRGDLRIWAGAVIYVVGSVNFLFDRTQRPHLTGDQLSHLTGISKSTLTNKTRLIRDVLRIGVFEPELCRREILESHPMAWPSRPRSPKHDRRQRAAGVIAGSSDLARGRVGAGVDRSVVTRQAGRGRAYRAVGRDGEAGH